MRSVMLRSSALTFVLAVCMSPMVAHACAVCFSPSDQNRDAYLGMTIILSLLPLAMIFGSIYWVYRQYKKADAAALTEIGEVGLDGVTASS